MRSSQVQSSPRPEHIPEWSELKEWQQSYEANRMTTLAAMSDRVDQEVERFVDKLRVNKELDNTLILFVSDKRERVYQLYCIESFVVDT